jgi:hypothetical protein
MHKAERYPYVLHTNRELEMMLAGAKPFAAFSHEQVDGFEKSDALANQDFDTHVSNGTLSEYVRTFQGRQPDGGPLTVHYYLYAVSGEEWRVEAYSLLLELLHCGAWCPQLEWLQGKLLGYTDEQNLYHISRTYPADQHLQACGPEPIAEMFSPAMAKTIEITFPESAGIERVRNFAEELSLALAGLGELPMEQADAATTKIVVVNVAKRNIGSCRDLIGRLLKRHHLATEATIRQVSEATIRQVF